MNRLFFASAVFAFLTVTIVPVRGATVEDEAAIRSVVGAQQQDAWNRHDSKIYAGLLPRIAMSSISRAGGGKAGTSSSANSPPATRSCFETLP